MELKLVGKSNEADHVSVSDVLFNRDYNEALVHQVVTSYLSNARGATRAQKGRSDVAKSTRKPWRQKGTGRARAGMASSPLWRGGGRIFPNSPNENYKKKLNKKMYRAGISTILSQLVRDGRLLVTDTFNLETHKTKELAEKLEHYGLNNVLVIIDEMNENLYLASRNIPHVAVVEVKNVDPVSLLRFESTLFTANSLKKFEEILS